MKAKASQSILQLPHHGNGRLTSTSYNYGDKNDSAAAMGEKKTQLTNIVVLAISAGGLHGGVAAGSSPSKLADTVPAIDFQSAAPITVTQTRTSLWKKQTDG